MYDLGSIHDALPLGLMGPIEGLARDVLFLLRTDEHF